MTHGDKGLTNARNSVLTGGLAYGCELKHGAHIRDTIEVIGPIKDYVKQYSFYIMAWDGGQQLVRLSNKDFAQALKQHDVLLWEWARDLAKAGA